jgi:flavin reductase (DIM6/NTAB) family NADH-FMN oxidoreductase RutF
VALDRGSDLLAKLRTTHRFGVNVLAHSQDGLAVRFAGKGADKFDGVPWEDADGLPRLHDAIGWLGCQVDSFVEAGDHLLLTGRVDSAVAIPAAPLAYHRRTFGTHSVLSGAAG